MNHFLCRLLETISTSAFSSATAAALTLVVLAAPVSSGSAEVKADYPRVTAPPDSFFEIVREQDRDAARQFYRKYIDVKGMPVVAAAEVADLALQRTYDIVTHMLAGRPDIIQAMVSNRMYLIVIGKDQKYTDMPEYRNSRNPEYQNERVRGTGGRPTSFGEENVLSLLLDRYDDESIAVHEFCHTIDGTLRSIDPTWSERKNKVYHNAVDKGLWKNTYAGSNAGEYWAEVAQCYFDNNRVNNWNHGPIGTREQLKNYDPEAYELAKATFNLSPEQDWRYTWVQKQPTVITPPAKFRIDPYYSKFTWAREFTVVGRKASDEALLKANDTVRKMFAYRHDVLKALIADGVKLVVLGNGETLSDLPELKSAPTGKVDLKARCLGYLPETKLLVAAEENVLGNPNDKAIGNNQVIREFAGALYHVTCLRPVDTNWNNRGRSVQQYELRVKRLDVQFDEKLKQIYETAMEKELWKGTPAAKSRVDYWAEGVVAYFDAGRRGTASSNGASPPYNRETLKDYDPDLYALVHETMAYEGKLDWRYKPYQP
jgi:alpha-glucosidase